MQDINKSAELEELILSFFFVSLSQDWKDCFISTFKPKEETFAIDPRVSFLVNDILREATQRGTGKAIKKLERDDFAGKTGTTNDSESAWFTGFNNKILTTVWFGYDQPRSLGTNEYGSTTALPIWLNFMEEIIDTIEYSIPAVPSNLIAKKINPSTGKEANSLDDNVRFEYFFD